MTVRHFSVRSSVQVSVVDQKIMEFICNENERSTNHMEPLALEGAVVLIDEPLDEGCRTSACALNHAVSLNGT